MFCGNCGKEIKNPVAKFCPECGSPVTSNQLQAEQMTSELPESEMQNYTHIKSELNEVELIPLDSVAFEEVEENLHETKVFQLEGCTAEENDKQTTDIKRQSAVNRQYNEWKQDQPTILAQPPASKKHGWCTAIGISMGVIILLICCATGVVVMRNRQSTDKASKQLSTSETVEPAENATINEEVAAEVVETEAAAENQMEVALETEELTEIPVPVTETSTEAASERETTTIVYVVRQLTGMTLTATSQLEDYESYSYSASNLFDGSLSTAYVEGVDGVGTGEQITINLDKTSCIDYIVWYPGYQISSDLLAKNGYPTELTFYFSDGSFVTSQFTGSLSIGTSVTVDVPDGVETSWICVEITGAVAGSKYEDTCISEVEIYGYEIKE